MMLTPKFVLGENKEALLKHLDRRIVDTSKRCNRFVSVGIAVLFSHMLYTQLTRPEKPHEHPL